MTRNDAIDTIADHCLNKYHPLFFESKKEAESYGITRVEVDGNTVKITAKHVGRLIGVKGKNIDDLGKLFEERFRAGIKVIEESESNAGDEILRVMEEKYYEDSEGYEEF